MMKPTNAGWYEDNQQYLCCMCVWMFGIEKLDKW